MIREDFLEKYLKQKKNLLKGKIKVYLYDTRLKSKTFKKYSELNIDTKKDVIMYFFPAGVAHGYITLSQENHMIYGTSGTYDPGEEYKINLSNELIPNFFKKTNKK